MNPIPLSDEQVKQAINAEQSYQAWWDAWRNTRDYAGGMHWKMVAGKQYLYKTHDRKGNAKSLGPRSETTETISLEFHKHKKAAEARVKALTERLQTQQRINAAMRLGSAPNIVAQLCLKLSQTSLMGKSLLVIGTNSLYAYEAMTGVRFASDVMATTDIDLLRRSKAKLSFTALGDDASDEGLMGVLHSVDKSFKRMDEQPFRAANDQGYLVDLTRQMPEPPWKNEPERIGGKQDLLTTDLWNMKWMLNAPRTEALAIATNGTVFPICAPDPRAYCAFKYWLSQSDERNPQKKSRDLAQARAVYEVIQDRLPHLAKRWGELKSIPKDVLQKVAKGRF